MSPANASSPDDEAQFRFLAENSVDIICRVGMDLVMTYASPSVFHTLGWTPAEMTGMPPTEYIAAEDLPILHNAVAQGLAESAETGSATVRMRKKDGSVAWMEMNARLIRDTATGEPREFVTVLRNITERRLREEQLSTLAYTDALTGLSNRRAFDAALEREWKRASRDNGCVSLLLLDLDFFKSFNDKYGHKAGDDCLRAVAAAVSTAVRATDVVARYGGEEIALILPGTDAGTSVQFAEKIRSAIIALRIAHEGRPDAGSVVTASIGAATALPPRRGLTSLPEYLLHAADSALYKAKEAGRNRVLTASLSALEN